MVSTFLIGDLKMESIQAVKEHKSFTAAAKAFFGLKPNESLQEFMGECKALTDDDKQEIAKGMEAHGIKIVR